MLLSRAVCAAAALRVDHSAIAYELDVERKVVVLACGVFEEMHVTLMAVDRYRAEASPLEATTDPRRTALDHSSDG